MGFESPIQFFLPKERKKKKKPVNASFPSSINYQNPNSKNATWERQKDSKPEQGEPDGVGVGGGAEGLAGGSHVGQIPDAAELAGAVGECVGVELRHRPRTAHTLPRHHLPRRCLQNPNHTFFFFTRIRRILFYFLTKIKLLQLTTGALNSRFELD